jgi:hypothetical protein
VRLGRYQFSGSEQVLPGRAVGLPPRFAVEQEVSCTDDPPPPVAEAVAEPVPADWRPTIEDERSVLALTNRYFALIDAGDAAAVHQLWVSSEQAATPLPERAASIEQFRREAGTPGQHRVAALTWYVNPDGAPRPGVYVAADYERSYAGLHLSCGYVVWYREGEGRYLLVREETGMVARSAGEMAPERLAEVRTLMRCPAG